MEVWALVALACCLPIFLILARLVLNFRDFKSQLNYLNQEIQRSSDHSRKHWKKRRRRLWLRFFFHPFF